MILERIFKFRNDSKYLVINWIRTLFVFLLISLIWVPFRAQNLQDTFFIYKKILVDFNIFELRYWVLENLSSLYILPLFTLILIEILTFKTGLNSILKWRNMYKFLFYSIVLFLIILVGQTKGGAFIYFQF